MERFVKVLSALTMVALLASCTDESAARKALERAGYSDIEVGGYDVWTCDKNDDFSTHFRARNPAGKIVEGTVCSGWLKGATIRF